MAIAVFTQIVKRNGRSEEFNPLKITKALAKAGEVTGEFGPEVAQKMTMRVINIAQQMFVDNPTVEGIQDIVEDVLLSSPTAKQPNRISSTVNSILRCVKLPPSLIQIWWIST